MLIEATRTADRALRRGVAQALGGGEEAARFSERFVLLRAPCPDWHAVAQQVLHVADELEHHLELGRGAESLFCGENSGRLVQKRERTLKVVTTRREPAPL